MSDYVDPELRRLLMMHTNLETHWEQWGTVGVTLSASANLMGIPHEYRLAERVLYFDGSCTSPYNRTDRKIRLTRDGLEDELFLEHSDVQWITFWPKGKSVQSRQVLWVNPAYRPT